MWERSPRLQPGRSAAIVAAILAGAALMLWPAAVNRAPILFADTQAFLVQGGVPFMIWDKPFAYGPAITLLHGGISLWGPIAAQALALSWLLWQVADAVSQARPLRHVGLCAFLAAGSAAPWFASLVMPDTLAPVSVLCVWLLGFRADIGWRRATAIAAFGVLAVASHLSHLVLACAVLPVVAMLRPRRLGVAALPLLGAVLVLLAGNAIGFGRIGLSPHGSVFVLARFTADGLVDNVLARHCPQSGWRLCAWQGRLPANSDTFLWDRSGPVWTMAGGPIAFAAEASEIVAATARENPAGVTRAVLSNTSVQLRRISLGDTLDGQGVDARGLAAVERFVGPAERTRIVQSRQSDGTLTGLGEALNGTHTMVLLAGALATIVVGLRGPAPLRALAVSVLLTCLANAAVTGGLSGPHDRYQARIAWLVLLAPALSIAGRNNDKEPAEVTAVTRRRASARRWDEGGRAPSLGRQAAVRCSTISGGIRTSAS